MIEQKLTNNESQLEEALKKLIQETREGLKHGFFKYSINCEIIKEKKRRLQIEAGKSYLFIIPENEIN